MSTRRTSGGSLIAERAVAWLPRLQLDTIAHKNPQIVWITFRQFSILRAVAMLALTELLDRKSTRLNSSHSQISYAVFCLKKKKASARSPFSSSLYLAIT